MKFTKSPLFTEVIIPLVIGVGLTLLAIAFLLWQ